MAKAAAHRWDYERSTFAARIENRTFSVGVFQWLPAKSGLKKSKSIRVSGYVAEPKRVYTKAAELCRKLNAAKAMADQPPDWLRKTYSVAEPSGIRPTTVGDRVADLVGSILRARLREQGFRQTRTTLWRNDEETCQTIQFELSRWGNSLKGTFRVSLGVFWHEVESRLKNPSIGRMPPPYWRCTFHIDLGFLTPTQRQSSWDVELETDLAEMRSRLLDQIVAYGLPYLAYRSQRANALERRRFVIRDDKGQSVWPESIKAAAQELFESDAASQVIK